MYLNAFGEGACLFKVPRGKKRSEFRELQEEWYARLRDEGFKDIEDTTLRDRPLLKWHSFYFATRRSQERQALHAEYLIKAEAFYNSPYFSEACQSLTTHGHSKLLRGQIEIIFVLHTNGFTEREIALELKRSKTCIHEILERLRQWMILL